MYMARTGRKLADRRRKASVVWRINGTMIPLWRKRKDLTQQELTDELAKLGPAFEYDRVSIGRTEAGEQNAPIMVLEAMAKILGAPHVTAMVDRTPDEALEIERIERMDAKERRRFLRLMDADREE